MSEPRPYVGRFAPSPTGPLHFGSAVAALASFLDARAAGGRWLIRIEDIDPPREIDEAPGWIIAGLESLGLAHDGDVLYQSTRGEAYEAALEQLGDQHLLYPCTCSRKSVPPVYPGRCRERSFRDTPRPFAVRIKTDSRVIAMEDGFAGSCHWHLADDVGDFIIRRKDQLIAYQLAVAVDDAAQGITDVVRGRDLLDSTPRQIYLLERLGLDVPRYAHFPVILGADGHKLSKQTFAPPIEGEDPLQVLRAALSALGQDVPAATTIDRLLQGAISGWDRRRVPGNESVREQDIGLQ